ncbi:MAG: methylmalonyl-CoA epimerase [Candidatus Zixiibacteriota bacterium]
MSGDFISHVGIAVRDLEKSIVTYELVTGRKVAAITEVPDQKVRVALFGETGGETKGARIELVAPTSDDSPVARFLQRHGEGLHHICIYVDSIDDRLEELKRAGVKLIDDRPRIGAEGDKIAFVHPAGLNGVLLELHQHAN